MSEEPPGLGDRTRSIRIVAGDRSYFQRPPCVERWLRNKVPSTQKHFLGYMTRFQLRTGLTPEQLLQWCTTVESVEVQDLIDKTSIEFKPAIQLCYRVAIRSFLRHNGYNSLPKTDLQYVSQQWHRGYRRGEIEKLLACLRQKIHRLFVVIAAESGLRSHVLIELRYRHIMEDLENGTVPVAVRLDPRFYVGKKVAGYTFLGEGVPMIQTCHGFRKYFENSLDDANIDHEKKMMIEGHFARTRAKHYTDRDVEQLRDVYRRAYPFIRLGVDEPGHIRTENEASKRFANLETRLDRQRVLQAKLTVLEDELDQMKQFRKRLEQQLG